MIHHQPKLKEIEMPHAALHQESDELIMRVLHTLRLSAHASWHMVFDAAVRKGESEGYSQFLANEWCRIKGFSRG